MDRFVEHFLEAQLTLEDVETRLTEAVLARSGNNVSAAAKRLGVTRPQLRYRVKQRALNGPRLSE